jgi:hypothetical protein
MRTSFSLTSPLVASPGCFDVPEHRNKRLLSAWFILVNLTKTKPFNFPFHIRPSRKTAELWGWEAAIDNISSNFTDQISFPSYADIWKSIYWMAIRIYITCNKFSETLVLPAGSCALPPEPPAPHSNIILHTSDLTSAHSSLTSLLKHPRVVRLKRLGDGITCSATEGENTDRDV